MEANRLGSGISLLAAAGLLLATASRAEARLIRIDFPAEVTHVSAGSSVIPGDPITGSIVYDASAEWTNHSSSPSQTNFNGTIVDFEIAGRHIEIQSFNIIHPVFFDLSRQTLSFGQAGFEDGFREQLDVRFEGPNLFDSVFELPVSFDFGEVTGAGFRYNLLDPRHTASQHSGRRFFATVVVFEAVGCISSPYGCEA
jgi:hypothetical protein